MTNPDIRAAFEALPENGKLNFRKVPDGSEYISFYTQLAWRDYQAATEAAKATSVAVGELFGYGSSEKKNCLLSKAQFDSCAPKNRTAYDIPLYAYSLPKCDGCKGYGVIAHVSGQTPDNYEECNEVCPDCEGEGIERQPAQVTVKTWQERHSNWESENVREAMEAEIEDLREALAATAAPVVLNDSQIKMIAYGHRIGSEVAVKFARAILAATRSQP